MIFLTTSRRPTPRLRTLCRDLSDSIPGVKRVNRGKMSFTGLIEKAVELGAKKVLIVDRGQDGCGKLRFLKIEDKRAKAILSMHIKGFKLRREFKKPARTVRRVCIDRKGDLGSDTERLKEFLSDFFNLPMEDLKETFKKYDAFIRLSIQLSNLVKFSFYSIPDGSEIGPRLTILKVAWNI